MLDKIDTCLKQNQSLNTNHLQIKLLGLQVSAGSSSKSSWIAARVASRFFNWSYQTSWEQFNTKIEGMLNLNGLDNPEQGAVISSKEVLGGDRGRFGTQVSEDKKTMVLAGSTFSTCVGEDIHALERDKKFR